jgi:hypothetical protein
MRRSVCVRVSACVVALFTLGLAACGASASSQASYPPMNLHFGADRWEYTTPQSMCSAVMTAEAVVGAHGTAVWNSVNSQRPAIADSRAVVEQGYRIYTPVTFARLNPLHDTRKAATTEYVVMGGQVGQDSMYVDPFPQLKDGARYVIVFSPGGLPAGKGRAEDWMVVYSAFPIDAHDMVLIQAAGSPNEPGTGPLQPEVKVSLRDLTKTLAACPEV